MKAIYFTRLQIDNPATGVAARRHRIAKKNSQKAVARKMGISDGYLSDLENGNRAWSEILVMKFNKANK